MLGVVQLAVGVPLDDPLLRHPIRLSTRQTRDTTSNISTHTQLDYTTKTILDAAAHIANSLKGILDTRQRQSALRLRLGETPLQAVQWIDSWLRDWLHPDGAAIAALDALAAVLTRPGQLEYEERGALYSAAKSADLDHIGFMVLEPAPLGEEFDAERPLEPRGRPLTLGERKSIARGTRRDILQKIVSDPHPAVVEILLGNPMLTERDVLAITSRRPIAAATLLQVVLSEKYRPRPRVRRSLCLNPHLPPSIAARLATTLPDGDLVELAGDGNLTAELREHALRLIKVRSAGRA